MDEVYMIQFLQAHKWAVLTFIGAIIVAGGAFKASIDQKKSEEKATKLTKMLEAKTEQLQKYQELTIQLQGEAIEELKHQTGMLTGGNSYPLLIVFGEHDKPFLIVPELMVGGQYPLFNFTMKIYVKNGPQKGKKHEYKLDELRQMTPTKISDLVFDLRKENNLELYVRLSARNGYWEQFIKFRKNDKGKYQNEIRLIAPHKSKAAILQTSFDDDSISIGKLSDIRSFEYYKQ